MATITPGESVQASITLTDSGGSAIDLSTLQGYAVVVSQFGEVKAKYSKNAVTGYTTGQITETDAANGVFELRIEQSITETLDEGDWYFEVFLQTTDNDYENNRFTKSSGKTKFDDSIGDTDLSDKPDTV